MVGWRSLQQWRLEQWGEQGFSWLPVDYWARQQAVKPAAMAAGVALLGFFLVEFLAAKKGKPWTGFSRIHRLWAHPVLFLLMGGAMLVPSLKAELSRPDTKGRPNVVLVCVDTWRADHASFLGYERETHPELAALAERGVVFEQAVAQAPWTMPSVATAFTSLVPSLHGARSHQVRQKKVRGRRWVRLSENHAIVSEYFRNAGYQTAAWSRNPNIRPGTGFGSGFQSFRLYRGESGRTKEMVAAVQKWLNRERDDDLPFFLYMHIMDPHYPYEAPAPFRGRWGLAESELRLTGELVEERHAGRLPLTDAQVQQWLDAYDEELLSMDFSLAPFLDELMTRFPNTVVLVFGDHGDEFLEHGQTAAGEPGLLGHGHTLYDELVHVPLLLWGPRIRPARVEAQVRVLDLLPTLVELGQLPQGSWPKSHWQGSSLTPILQGLEQESRPAPMETGGDGRPPHHYRGLRTGDWKLIRREVDADNPEPYFELFHLREDPKEQVNLAAAQPERVARMFQQLRDSGWYFDSEDPRLPQGLGVKGQVSPSMQRELNQLGYGGGEEEEEE